MPTIEDPFDDPWQGKWITAETNRAFTVRATEAASDGQPWAKVEADQERVELPQTGKPLEAKIDAQ
jgi:hypothetical protein